MRRKAQDNDPFDIKKDENRYSNKERCKVMRSDTDYSHGERSPYADWTGELGGFDPIDPDNFEAKDQPWALIPMDGVTSARWEAFLALVPTLKGRQQQIAEMMLEGELNQSEIARRLSMDQRNVAIQLKKLCKKVAERSM